MIRRLNHAVLWVRDVQRAAGFYTDILGFRVVGTFGSQGVFLRAEGSTNDHDLALFEVGDRPGAPPQTPGLYHLAWQVGTIDELAELHERLLTAGALGGTSDHGVSKSLYGRDVDGIEFEAMWAAPRHAWPDQLFTGPLDLTAERERWRGVDTASQ
jgi:catechol-2,3-dioxygenase